MTKRKIYVDKDFHTVPIQRKSGLLAGRRRTNPGEKSDRTAVLRNKETGEILGRTPSGVYNISVRGSSNSRGYIRRTI
jgi:hypothetical protein